jgi:hypothetical protein
MIHSTYVFLNSIMETCRGNRTNAARWVRNMESEFTSEPLASMKRPTVPLCFNVCVVYNNPVSFTGSNTTTLENGSCIHHSSLEMLIVAQMVKKLFVFLEYNTTLPCHKTRHWLFFWTNFFLRPTQPPIQLVPGVKCGLGVTLTTHSHLVPRSKVNGSCISSPPWRLHGGSKTALLLQPLLWDSTLSSDYCTSCRWIPPFTFFSKSK